MESDREVQPRQSHVFISAVVECQVRQLDWPQAESVDVPVCAAPQQSNTVIALPDVWAFAKRQKPLRRVQQQLLAAEAHSELPLRIRHKVQEELLHVLHVLVHRRKRWSLAESIVSPELCKHTHSRPQV